MSEDGSDHGEPDDGYQWGQRPTSPNPSVAQFAANFAQRVGSLVSNMSGPRSPQLLTDEELEAQAERERDRTRMEAERILTREAETKRLEERVLAMLDSDMRRTTSPFTPPAPPALMSSTPPSPASSSKEGSGWFSVVKNKLTPTKESLTPAQQIILDTKARDKEAQKEGKKLEKEKKEVEKEMKKSVKKQSKQRSGDWPSSPEGKFGDPAFLKLHGNSPQPRSPSRQMTSSPTSPTPGRQNSMPPSLAPSPMRNDTSSSSPARHGAPLYAQFNTEGALDIPTTLLTIATRFEKLERWTVGHVRALEERMDDVERWLVEKEKDKEEQSTSSGVIQHQTGEPPTMEAAIHELRDELAEVQGRIGELGREMAKMVTAPNNLNSGPSRGSASIGRAPSASSSIAVRSISSHVSTAPRMSTPPKKEPSISPVTTPSVPSGSSRTRLPYPTGDYATPPDSVLLNQGAFSPPGSPPTNPHVGRRISVSGLPTNGQEYFSSADNSPSGLPLRAQSPPSLPLPPERSDLRRASVSPTPRKRYTVALGGPIMAPDRGRDQDVERPATPRSRSTSRDFTSIPTSTSPISFSTSLDTTDESDTGGNDETIGKTAARRSGLTIPKFKGLESDRESQSSPSPAPQQQRRVRPISMYTTPSSSMSNLAAPAPVRPLNTRLRSRSRSTDRFSSLAGSDSSVPPTPTSGKFVDPLIKRRQTKEAAASGAPAPPKVLPGKPKVPVGQLVAFFNQEKA